MTLLNRMAVLKGAAVAIVLCLPLAIVSNVVRDRDPTSPLLPVLFVLTAAGFAVAGWVAARSEGDAPYSNGAFAALGGGIVIEVIALVVHVAGGRSLHVAALVGSALIAYAAGILGAFVGTRS